MDTLDFFRELYGKCDKGWITIWTRQDKRTYWFEVAEMDKAVDAAQKLSRQQMDVYFGVGLRREKVYKTTKTGKKYLARGEKEDVCCIPGLWMDIDVAGEAHKEKSLPPSIDAAIELVNEFQLKPSILVNSGHGLHGYWLFRKPFVFADEEDRKKAGSLLERFQLTFKAEAKKRGWNLDTTSDLARVLRVPGTMNYKSHPVQVEIIKVKNYVPTV